MALYIGIMQNPTLWSSPADLALMNSLCHCFEKFREPATTRNLCDLMAVIKSAAEKAQYSTGRMQGTAGHLTPRGSMPTAMPLSIQGVGDPGPSSVTASGAIHTSLSQDEDYRLGLGHNDKSDGLMPSIGSSQVATHCLGNSHQGGSWEAPQFEDFFGDGSSSWNMQLWPLISDLANMNSEKLSNTSPDSYDGRAAGS